MLLMSREIKFRVWEPLNKNMHFLNFALYENKGHVNHWVLPLNHQCCSDKNYTIMNLNNVEIMQYTGLKDKNGKEIYEGDILRCKCLKKCKLDSYAEKVIQYKNSLIEWWESGCNLGYRLRDSKGKTMMIKPTHLRTMEVEVIGNIYENPELLEGER